MRVLYYCNGGHYGESAFCKWSGYASDGWKALTEQLKPLQHPASYAVLVDAGKTEERSGA